jgi:hypothetical protein
MLAGSFRFVGKWLKNELVQVTVCLICKMGAISALFLRVGKQAPMHPFTLKVTSDTWNILHLLST